MAVYFVARCRPMPNNLPEIGYVRLRQILGDPKAKPPVPAIYPISKSSWWEGVRSGRFPKPVKLGPNTTAWHVEDIRTLIEQVASSTGDSGDAQ